MDEKLKQCPLCDGEAELKQGFYVIDNYVECLKCGTRTAYYQTKARAIKRWNTRKPMDRIVEEIKDYRELVPSWALAEIIAIVKGVQNEF